MRLLLICSVSFIICSCVDSQRRDELNLLKWVVEDQGLLPTETLTEIKPRKSGRLCTQEFGAITKPEKSSNVQEVCFCGREHQNISFQSNQTYYLLRATHQDAYIGGAIFTTKDPTDDGFYENATIISPVECTKAYK